MAQQTRLILTSQGKAKLAKMAEIAKVAAQASLKKGVERITKPSIQKTGPTPRQEAEMISKPGVPTGGRFMKVGAQKYIRTAIKEEPVEIRKTKGEVWADFGRCRRLNNKIGFSWQTKPSKKEIPIAEIRKTSDPGAGPFWNQLIEGFEYGGSFTVQSRKGPGSALHIAPGVFRKRVAKTIMPFRMFAKGYKRKKEHLQKYVSTQVRQAIRKRVK